MLWLSSSGRDAKTFHEFVALPTDCQRDAAGLYAQAHQCTTNYKGYTLGDILPTNSMIWVAQAWKMPVNKIYHFDIASAHLQTI